MVCLGDAGARADSFMRSLPLSLGVKVALGVAAIAIWAALPWLISRGSVDILVFTCVYAIAGLGVAFLLGQCGVVSVAQSVFYGIGAYSTAYGTTVLGWPIPVCMLMGIVLSGLVATIVGIPVLRLSGYFLALATLALAVIGDVLFLEWDWLTNGTLGIGGIPHISLFGLVLNTPFRFYYFVWPCAAIILWLHYNLLRSRAGIALSAIRDAPDAAKVIGVQVSLSSCASLFSALYSVRWPAACSLTMCRSSAWTVSVLIAPSHSFSLPSLAAFARSQAQSSAPCS